MRVLFRSIGPAAVPTERASTKTPIPETPNLDELSIAWKKLDCSSDGSPRQTDTPLGGLPRNAPDAQVDGPLASKCQQHQHRPARASWRAEVDLEPEPASTGPPTPPAQGLRPPIEPPKRSRPDHPLNRDDRLKPAPGLAPPDALSARHLPRTRLRTWFRISPGARLRAGPADLPFPVCAPERRRRCRRIVEFDERRRTFTDRDLYHPATAA